MDLRADALRWRQRSSERAGVGQLSSALARGQTARAGAKRGIVRYARCRWHTGEWSGNPGTGELPLPPHREDAPVQSVRPSQDQASDQEQRPRARSTQSDHPSLQQLHLDERPPNDRLRCQRRSLPGRGRPSHGSSRHSTRSPQEPARKRGVRERGANRFPREACQSPRAATPQEALLQRLPGRRRNPGRYCIPTRGNPWPASGSVSKLSSLTCEALRPLVDRLRSLLSPRHGSLCQLAQFWSEGKPVAAFQLRDHSGKRSRG